MTVTDDWSPSRLDFFDPRQFPSLQTVWVRTVNAADRPGSVFIQIQQQSICNIKYPKQLLPTIVACLRQSDTHGHESTRILRQSFAFDDADLEARPHHASAADLRETNLVIDRLGGTDIKVKSRYRFGIRGGIACYVNMNDIAFEDWFEVVVVWDRYGISIEELPDLKEMAWWEQWSAYCLENPRVELALGESYQKQPLVFWCEGRLMGLWGSVTAASLDHNKSML